MIYIEEIYQILYQKTDQDFEYAFFVCVHHYSSLISIDIVSIP